MHIVSGIGGIVIAYLLIRYRRQLYDFTGPWGWAERFLGAGGTATAIVLVALVIFFVSVTVMTGNAQRFVGGTVGRIF